MSEPVLWYAEPRPVAEIRSLDCSPAVIDGQHRSHVMALAAWFSDIERRTGRTIGSLLASESREHKKRLAEIRELEQMRQPKLSPLEALMRLEME